MTLAASFIIGAGLSLALTPVCRAAARAFGYVARPKEDRWHKRPTALFGGVAIGLSVLGAGALLPHDRPLWDLMACGTLIWICGFLDDLLSLKPSTKLIAQISVASLLLFLGYRLQWTNSMIGDAMLTLFWIVGITNAFNLLDNMDGLCAGTAVIAGSFVLLSLVGENGITPVAMYMGALLGATTGFLVYNIHPASIFMGDTGSLFLGLNLAATSLMAAPAASGKSSLLTIVAAPVLLLLVPIFDTTLVTALRLLSGRKPSQGGRDHTSHRLVAIGLSEPRAVATLWLLSAAGGVIGFSLRAHDPTWAGIAALTFVLAMVLFAVYLGRIRVYADADLSVLRTEAMTPLVTDFMYKRRVAEVLLDLCLIPLAYYSAYRLRFEGSVLGVYYPQFIQSLPIVLAAQLAALFVFGGYRGTWRYFGMMDAVVFGKSVLAGTVGAELVVLYLYRFENYSRSVFVIYAALLFLLLSGTRASFRLVGEFVQRRRAVGRRCVIYGTSGASLTTIREAFGESEPLKIVGFVDDDPRQRNVRVGGYAVLGGGDALIDLVLRGEVDCIVMNAHLADASRLVQLEEACQANDVELLRLQVNLKPLSAVS